MATESSSTCREPKKTKQTSHLLREVLPNLPSEIIYDILSRLPVKSLLRFRCVSKLWRSLISQPEFAKTHLSLASRNNDYGHHKLVLSEQDGCIRVNCSLYSISNELSETAVKLDCLVKGPDCRERIVGCCDGLVCIVSEREVRIWNPSTRKAKRFPNVEMQYLYVGRYVRYGFGFDESIDDYKVVGFFRDVNTGLEFEAQVCTLGTHSWRRIGSFPFCLPSDGLVTNLNGSYGIFVSGALHWFSGGNCGRIIVSLDLAKEPHGEVMEPHYQRGTSLYKIRFRLDVLNGCLCILATYYDCIDVWVMKEYGIRESWAKLVTITYAAHPFDGYPYSQPLCILANGEILLDVHSQLVLYNCKDGTFSRPMIQIFSSFSVHTYVESLVSPDTDADSGV